MLEVLVYATYDAPNPRKKQSENELVEEQGRKRAELFCKLQREREGGFTVAVWREREREKCGGRARFWGFTSDLWEGGGRVVWTPVGIGGKQFLPIGANPNGQMWDPRIGSRGRE